MMVLQFLTHNSTQYYYPYNLNESKAIQLSRVDCTQFIINVCLIVITPTSDPNIIYKHTSSKPRHTPSKPHEAEVLLQLW